MRPEEAEKRLRSEVSDAHCNVTPVLKMVYPPNSPIISIARHATASHSPIVSLRRTCGSALLVNAAAAACGGSSGGGDGATQAIVAVTARWSHSESSSLNSSALCVTGSATLILFACGIARTPPRGK